MGARIGVRVGPVYASERIGCAPGCLMFAVSALLAVPVLGFVILGWTRHAWLLLAIGIIAVPAWLLLVVTLARAARRSAAGTGQQP